MLIQNISNQALTPQTAAVANDRLASNGGPEAVVSIPSAAVEQPQIAAQQVAGQQPSTAQLKSAVDNINQMLKQANKGVEFSMDESTEKRVIKVVDSTTGDVIRQFPSEEALAITRAIDNIQQGLLLKQKA